MSTSISQESLENHFSSPKRTSKYNLLAILFFLMGAPHIYSFIQRGSNQRKALNIHSDKGVFSAPTLTVFRFSFNRYLSFLLLGLLGAGIIEIFLF